MEPNRTAHVPTVLCFSRTFAPTAPPPHINASRMSIVSFNASEQSRRLTKDMVKEADHIYVMEKGHRDMILRFWPEAKTKVHLLTEFLPAEDKQIEGADIPDPIQMSEDFYAAVLKMIDGCVRKIAETI